MECFSAIKKNEILAGEWMEVEVSMLSEVRHIQKDNACLFSQMQDLDLSIHKYIYM
jgi:hypothetical protein